MRSPRNKAKLKVKLITSVGLCYYFLSWVAQHSLASKGHVLSMLFYLQSKEATIWHSICGTNYVVYTQVSFKAHGLSWPEKCPWFKGKYVFSYAQLHTKANTVHGRPTPKDVECFRNRSVHKHYERSTMSEYFWVILLIIKNYTISSELCTELFSVSLQPIHEYHQVFRHDHEPSRIHNYRTWNVLLTNGFMQLYPNHLNCTVIGKLENKKIQQSLPLQLLWEI